MGLLGNAKTLILKKGSRAQEQLQALEALQGTLNDQGEKALSNDIRLLKTGIIGENRILYELENSHMDMIVLQDMFLEHEGLRAQIDFLVLTRQRNFVIECKNLYGDIEINSRGDFIRSFHGKRREGIYSPLTQNERHLNLIRALRRPHRGLIANLFGERSFDDIYRSLIVLANPSTILNDRHAPAEIRQHIIRADQLITTIQTMNNAKGIGRTKIPMAEVESQAEWFLAKNACPAVDYTQKYQAFKKTPAADDACSENECPACPKCGAPMIVRSAKRGEHRGERFYGCSSYPACRAILPIS